MGSWETHAKSDKASVNTLISTLNAMRSQDRVLTGRVTYFNKYLIWGGGLPPWHMEVPWPGIKLTSSL